MSTRKIKIQAKEKPTKKLRNENNDFDINIHKEISGNVNSEGIVKDFQVIYDLSKTQSSGNQIIGEHESQESEGGEADLHKYLAGCKKNPGHSQFIPVDTFTLKHLPEGYQDIDLYELIKSVADMTVRIDLKIASPHRPKFWPDTTQPYPFYNMRDTRNLRTGSGWVSDVKRILDGIVEDNGMQNDYTICWCRKCQDSNFPSDVWWEFDVVTATHVVFDDIEARHTTLRFFYDRDDSPLISVDKINFEDKSIKYDRCLLKGVTCDKNLGDKLKAMFNYYEHVWWKVFNKYLDTRDRHKFNFIVSHPHGCSKQVSLGQWKDQYKQDDNTRLTYTTCTCPGSSGAHVHCLGYNWRWSSDLVHSGSLKSGLNYSGFGRVV